MSENQAEEWLTDEIRALLAAITGEHIVKKRTTAMLIGYAKATDKPLTDVFAREDTCSEAVWWRSWSKNAAIQAVVEAVKDRVEQWTAEELAKFLAVCANERKRKIGKWAAAAPDALAAVMGDRQQRGSDRINAAVTLIKLSDPQETANVGTVAGGVEQTQMVGLFDDAKDRLARLLGENPTSGGEAAPAERAVE